MLKRLLLIGSILAALLAAQEATRVLAQRQVRVDGQEGDALYVGPAQNIVAAAAAKGSTTVFGSPSAPGCVAMADGAYKLPRVPVTLAVYRNGLRASLPNEYTLNGQVITIGTPIPDEAVLCDYTY